MIDYIPVALELSNTVMVVVVCIDVLAIDIRVAHKDSLIGIRTRGALGHTVCNTQVCRTVGQIIVVLVLVDVGSFHSPGTANLQLGRFRIEALHILVQLIDIEDVIVIILSRAGITITTAKGEVARTVGIIENSRVKAPTDTIAVCQATAPIVDQLLVVGKRIAPGTSNAVGTDKADTAATAIGEHDIKSTIVGILGYARGPDIINTAYLTGIINNTEIRPVLHILGTEAIESLNVVTRCIIDCRVVGVRNDVEVFVVGGSTRVCQVVIGRNRVVCETKSSETRNHTSSLFKAKIFPNIPKIHKDSLKAKHTKPSHPKITLKKGIFSPCKEGFH